MTEGAYVAYGGVKVLAWVPEGYYQWSVRRNTRLVPLLWESTRGESTPMPAARSRVGCYTNGEDGHTRRGSPMTRLPNLLALALSLALSASMAVGAAGTERDIVLLLDNSGSMKKNDPQFLTRRAVREFLSSLDPRTRVAMVIFDEKVQLAAPLTPVTKDTKDGLLAKLDLINYRGKFTNSPAGMERAIYEIKNHGRKDAEKIILFMTDGIVDTGHRARDRELAKWMREALADEAASAGIQIFGIAFTEAADFQLMQTLSYRTGGSYFRAMAAEDIGGAFERIHESLQRPPAPTEPSVLPSPSKELSTPPQGISAPEPAVSTGTAPVIRAPRPPPEPASPEVTPARTVPTREETEPPAQPPPLQTAQPALVEPFTPPPLGSAGTPSAPGWQAAIEGWAQDPTLLLTAAGGFLALVTLSVALAVRRRKVASVPTLAAQAESARTTGRYPPPFCLLKDISGVTGRESHDITGRLTRISRVPAQDSPNVRTLVIKDDYISREHALIEYRDYGYWIADRGSINGTFVNDERITGERLLKHGDRLRFHTYEFAIVLPEMEEQGQTMLAPIPNKEDETLVVGDDQTVIVGREATGEPRSEGPATEPTLRHDDGESKARPRST